MSTAAASAGFAVPSPKRVAESPLPSERLVQIGIATMATLGTLLLGMGERNTTLPVLALIVSVSSVYLTDMRGWLRFNNATSNLLALLAMAWTVWGFAEIGVELQLLAVANLLVYLQFILQYQKKTIRTYWLLALLSLVQCAVSTALNLQLVYGFLLLVYMFVSLATMTVFFLYRETVRQRSGSAAHVAMTISQQVDAVQRFFSGERRSHRPPIFVSRESLQIRHDVASWLFVRQIIMLALGSLVLSMLVFVTVPRFEKRDWQQSEIVSTRSAVGFSDSVSLGEIRSIANNPSNVMRVQFQNPDSGTEYEVRGEVYFRGVVLTRYRDGRWTHPSDNSEPVKLDKTDIPPVALDAVEQVITLEPLETGVLFSIYPLAMSPENPNVLFDVENQHLLRPRSLRESRFTYELMTTGLDEGTQISLTPTSGYRFSDLRLPSGEQGDPLEPLRQLTAELVEDIPAEEPYRRIRAIQEFLQDQREFEYTTNLTREDMSLDPIVDFLVNTRSGHCEYFASAMALMLRSVGIPARIVVGYRSGEYNPIGGYYQVRQLHAHAWTEAYLDPGQFPADLPFKGGPESAAWLRLDPTPQYSGIEQSNFSDSRWNFIRQFTDYLDFLWSHYVLGMDARRQQESIYTPIVQGISQFFQRVQDPQAWRNLGRRCLALLGVGPNGWVAGEWFYWRAGLLAMLICLFIVSLYQVSKLPAGWIVSWMRGQEGKAREDSSHHVEFYRRLEHALKRHKMLRPQNQTQREFAQTVGAQLADDAATQAVAGVPGQVAGAFYRVRFGQATLDRSEAEAVEHALSRLEHALAAAQETQKS